MKKWVIMAALALLAQAAVAQQPQAGAQEYVEGEAAFKKGDWDGAIAALEKSIAAGGPVAAHFYLGLAYQKKQNHGKAVEHLGKYVAEQPTVWQAQMPLAVSLRALNKNDEATQHFAKVIELKPDIAEPYYYVGRHAYSAQKYGEAASRLQKFLELKPDSPQAAEAYYMLGHMAVIKAGESADPIADNERAKANLEKFLQLKPDSPLAPDAYFMLGTIAAKKVESLEPPENKEPTPEAKAAMAEQYTTAKNSLGKFLELKPTSPQAADAHFTLGSLAIRLEDDAAAKLHFQKFLELRPEGPQTEEVKKILGELRVNPKK